MLVRLQGRIAPYWQASWPTGETLVTADVRFISRTCPECGETSNRVVVYDHRPTLPGDETLPILFCAEGYVSPRGAFRYVVSGKPLRVPHYHQKSCAVLFWLLSNDARVRRYESRRYYSAELWNHERILLSQDGDVATHHILVRGEVLDFPLLEDWEVQERTHRRCAGERRARTIAAFVAGNARTFEIEIGCTKISVRPWAPEEPYHMHQWGVCEVDGWSCPIWSSSCSWAWDGDAKSYEEYGRDAPVESRVLKKWAPELIEGFKSLDVTLYIELEGPEDPSTPATGRVALFRDDP